MTNVDTVLTEAAINQAFSLHGKTIKGTMALGDTFAIDFEDDTSLWLKVHRGGILVELREGINATSS